jgi:undecaprenyl-phosphate galactose phosphotransferase
LTAKPQVMDVLLPEPMPLRIGRTALVRSGWLLAAVDLVVIYACVAIGRSIKWILGGLTLDEAVFGWVTRFGDERMLVYLGLGLVCLIIFRQLGHYQRRRPFWQELGDIFGIVLTMAIIDAALVVLTKTNFSRMWWFTSWSLVALLLPFARYGVKRFLIASGSWVRPAVIVGTGPNAIDAADALASEPLLGFDVVAFVRPPNKADHKDSHLEVEGCRYPVFDPATSPHLLPAHLGRPHVVVALEMDEMSRCASFVERLNLLHGDVDIVSPMRGLPIARTRVTHFFSQDVLALRLYNNLAPPWPRRVKRAFDLVACSLLLIAVAPLFALISWRIARTGAPVFFGHDRIGRGGKPFRCLKFRTMVPHADRVLRDYLDEHPELREEWQRDHKLKDDPRITPIGAWLRRTSLDELPQLLNILRGHMSLVGPRPVVEEELERYGDNVVYYLESTPGLTGLWQVSGRNDLDYRRRVHLDSWYVKNWSLWCDLIILFKTPRAVVRGHGAY